MAIAALQVERQRMLIAGEQRLRRSRYKPGEQRMRGIWARLKLWMELGRNKPGMIAQLDDFDETSVRRVTRHDETIGLKLLSKLVVKLESMPMALQD